jgi:hypothetical protein
MAFEEQVKRFFDKWRGILNHLCSAEIFVMISCIENCVFKGVNWKHQLKGCYKFTRKASIAATGIIMLDMIGEENEKEEQY